MLTKNDDAAAPANADIWPVAAELAKLAKLAGIPDFAKLAGIADSKVDLFSNELLGTIKHWLWYALCRIQTPWIADVHDAVYDPANNLYRRLKAFVKAFDDAQDRWRNGARLPQHPSLEDDLLWTAVRLRLRENTVSIPLLADLDALAKTIKNMRTEIIGEKKQGRPRGVKGYPGLNMLVFDLERSARVAGGGFHLNKRDRKGSLLDALDLLRAVFLSDPKTEPWGMLLPPPNQHPVSTYHRVMKFAREETILADDHDLD
jgi:hypothetical protein